MNDLIKMMEVTAKLNEEAGSGYLKFKKELDSILSKVKPEKFDMSYSLAVGATLATLTFKPKGDNKIDTKFKLEVISRMNHINPAFRTLFNKATIKGGMIYLVVRNYDL